MTNAELEIVKNLLAIVSQMAVKQAELIEIIARLSEKLNGLQMIATPSTVVNSNQQNVYDDMMEFGDE